MPKAKRTALILKSAFKNCATNQNEQDECIYEPAEKYTSESKTTSPINSKTLSPNQATSVQEEDSNVKLEINVSDEN